MTARTLHTPITMSAEREAALRTHRAAWYAQMFAELDASRALIANAALAKARGEAK